MENKVQTKEGKFWFDGEKVKCVIGRSSFKLANQLTYHFSGIGGWETKALRWVEWNQKIGVKLLRVFLETGDWGGHPMFGSEPVDKGFWDVANLRVLSERGQRVDRLTSMGEKVIDWIFEQSHKTGMAFELVIDATLKHTDRLDAGIIDHVIRQVSAYMREAWFRFPNAKIIVEARNEWDAHNVHGVTLPMVNNWAKRFYRWKSDVDTKQSFTSPGPAYSPEQWPEGCLIVSHGGRDTIDYDVGPAPDEYKAAIIHPERASRPWEVMPDLAKLRQDARGQPVGFNESKLLVELVDESRAASWYGAGQRSWTSDGPRYVKFFETSLENVDYFVIHDEKGMQTDVEWPRRVTQFEAYLEANYGVGDAPPPVPPPTTPPKPPKRPGFFDRLFQGIADFFVNLFGGRR